MQIVTNGTSSRLRKKALQNATHTLTNLLIDGQKYATSSAQADGIEEQFKTKPKENINTTTMATPAKKSVWYCGLQGHFAEECRSRENKEQGKDGKKGFSSPDNVIRRHGTKKQQAKAVEGGLCLYRIKGTKQENTRKCYSKRTKCTLCN